ncbi:MAG: alpha/beta hydrolase [Rhabdochlamydiaceae bacterium]|nr:alpha/beta hydrolase [Candidatus Amphrikana amoebophyrae]
MPISKVNEIELFYEVKGKGEPLLIIPGITCDHKWADALLPELTQHFEVLLVDSRGVGLSSAPEDDYTVKMMAKDIFELVQKHKWKKPHVLGSSLGGAIAQRLVYDNPESFAKLILSTTCMKFLAPTVKMFEVLSDLYAISAPREVMVKMHMAIANGDKFLSDKYKSEEAYTAMIEHPHFQTAIGYRGQFAALKEFNSTNWAAKIKNPTLIIGADEDLICPIEQSFDLHEKIEQSHLMIIPQSGHAVSVEQTDLYVEHIIDYLENDTPTIAQVAI